eukprot:2578363-Rhodomonas_salina.5
MSASARKELLEPIEKVVETLDQASPPPTPARNPTPIQIPKTKPHAPSLPDHRRIPRPQTRSGGRYGLLAWGAEGMGRGQIMLQPWKRLEVQAEDEDESKMMSIKLALRRIGNLLQLGFGEAGMRTVSRSLCEGEIDFNRK